MATKKGPVEISAIEKLLAVLEQEPGRIVEQDEIDDSIFEATKQAEPLLWVLMNSGKFSSMVDRTSLMTITHAWVVVREFVRSHEGW